MSLVISIWHPDEPIKKLTLLEGDWSFGFQRDRKISEERV